MHLRTLAGLGFGALRYRLRGRRAPLNVMLAVTNRCTGRCSYCAIPERDQDELSTAEILELIDLLAERGTRRIALWGGEPLLREDIGRIVNRCVRHRMWTSMDSNGLLFPQRFAEVRALSHVVFSLDGRRQGHDANRGAGSYDAVQDAIRCAASEGFSFWTLTVLTRHNLDDIEHILELAETFGHRAAFQVLHHTAGLAAGRGDPLLPEPEAYRDAIRRLMSARERGRPVANSTTGLAHLLRWPDYAEPILEELPGAPRCLGGELFCNIDVDGTVYPCSLQVDLLPAANLRDVGFDRAFDQAADHPCTTCSATAFTEYSLLFGLHPATAAEWIRGLGVEVVSRRRR